MAAVMRRWIRWRKRGVYVYGVRGYHPTALGAAFLELSGHHANHMLRPLNYKISDIKDSHDGGQLTARV